MLGSGKEKTGSPKPQNPKWLKSISWFRVLALVSISDTVPELRRMDVVLDSFEQTCNFALLPVHLGLSLHELGSLVLLLLELQQLLESLSS